MFTVVIGFFVLVGILLVGLVLVAHGTAAKNRWGMNLEPVHCPRCDERPPRGRRPHTLREMLWGGWTCRSCGCPIDKWGRQMR
jgi:hypothetical protein